jgi:predicted metal-binding membrane protein
VSTAAAPAPGLRIRVAPTAIVLAAAALAWLGVVAVVRHMGAMPGTMGVGIGEFVAIWALMMAAMMLPSVAPFVSLYARTLKGRRAPRLTSLTAGYLVVWAAAGVPAYGIAWLADRAINGHPLAATILAVVVFAACGVYQLTPLKERCLAHCRSPLGAIFKYASYRGSTRDFRVGLHHGGYCLACCWSLMVLLVAFGLMNVTAMVVLSIIILIEKIGPSPKRFSQAVGIVAIGLAVAVAIHPALAAGLHQMPGQMGQMGHMNQMGQMP